MGKNPLGDGDKPKFDRSKWTLQQHCDWANAQVELNETNAIRRSKGLGSIQWAIRDGRVMIEPKPSARIEAFGRDRGTGLDAQHESRISANETPNYPVIPSS